MYRYLFYVNTQRTELTLSAQQAKSKKRSGLQTRSLPEIPEIVNFRPPEKQHFDKCSDHFAYNFEV